MATVVLAPPDPTSFPPASSTFQLISVGKSPAVTDSVAHPLAESSQIATAQEDPSERVPVPTTAPSALVQVQYALFQPSPNVSDMVSVCDGSVQSLEPVQPPLELPSSSE